MKTTIFVVLIAIASYTEAISQFNFDCVAVDTLELKLDSIMAGNEMEYFIWLNKPRFAPEYYFSDNYVYVLSTRQVELVGYDNTTAYIPESCKSISKFFVVEIEKVIFNFRIAMLEKLFPDEFHQTEIYKKLSGRH